MIGNIKLSIGNIHIRYEDIERYLNFCLVDVSFRVHIRIPWIFSVAIQATLSQQVWYFRSCQQLLWMTMGRKLLPLVEIWTEWRRYILLTSQHFGSVINTGIQSNTQDLLVASANPDFPLPMDYSFLKGGEDWKPLPMASESQNRKLLWTTLGVKDEQFKFLIFSFCVDSLHKLFCMSRRDNVLMLTENASFKLQKDRIFFPQIHLLGLLFCFW